jgi:hypothetical protein
MDLIKTTKAEHTVTLRISAADLIASLPKKYRTLIASGTAFVFVTVPAVAEAGDELRLDLHVPVQVRITYSTETEQ